MDVTALKAKAEAFAAMHSADKMLVLANAWDVITARLFVDSGFPAIATTSGGVAFAQGYPDGERIGRDEMLAVVGAIASRIPVPLSADMEGGYGPAPEDVAETVRRTIAAGAVGINIEDGTKQGPEPLVAFTLAVERIRAGREAADAAGVPMVINARTDGFHTASGPDVLDEAVRRANAYYEAGAGCLFVPWARDRATIAELVRQIDGPVNILAAPDTPPTAELQALGVARVTVGASMCRAALTFLRGAARELGEKGTYESARGALSQGDVHALLA